MPLAGLETSLGYAVIGRQAGRFVAADPDAMPGAEDMPMEAMPPVMDGQAGFPVGTEVHDFLSGLDGVIVEPLAGTSPVGGITFVRFADDAETHAIRIDQLELKQAALPMLPPEVPGAGAEAGLPPAVEPIAEAGPAPKAALESAPAPAVVVIKAGDKSGMAATTVVGDGVAGSGRDQTYGQIFEAAGARITAAKLLELFGYVPKQWDAVIAALEADGVRVLRVKGEADIMAKAALGLNEKEIVTEICAAFGAVQAETVAKLDAMRTQAVVARRQDAARKLNLEALQAAGTYEMVDEKDGVKLWIDWNQSQKGTGDHAEDTVHPVVKTMSDKTAGASMGPMGWISKEEFETPQGLQIAWDAVGGTKENLKAGIPSKPQPDNPPAGMIYAWDDQKQDWYLQKLSDNQESVVV